MSSRKVKLYFLIIVVFGSGRDAATSSGALALADSPSRDRTNSLVAPVFPLMFFLLLGFLSSTSTIAIACSEFNRARHIPKKVSISSMHCC